MRPMDSHTHYYWDDPQYAVSQLDRYQYSHLTILGLPGDLLSNIQAMMAKNARPEQVFTFGCLMYAEGLQPTPESHKAQLQMLMDAGFDGWKIIETKPTTYTAVGRIPLDSDIFEPAFALAEEKQFPITWHCGDPATFWDEEACPDWAKENGWFYDDTFPTLQELYRQVETVLDRHPGLLVTLAHMYFTSDDIHHAKYMLDRHPNLRLDLCPGTEMYENFVKAPEIWHDFFVKYQDRLIFGTDRIGDPHDKNDVTNDWNVDVVLKSIFATGPVHFHSVQGTALGVPDELKDKIFALNYAARVGTKPRALNKAAFITYAQWLMPYMCEEKQIRCKEMLQKLQAE